MKSIITCGIKKPRIVYKTFLGFLFLGRFMRNLDFKIARIKQNVTQYDLMYHTRISQGRISLFEKGVRQPTPEEAQKIAKALQVKVGEIFPETWARMQGVVK